MRIVGAVLILLLSALLAAAQNDNASPQQGVTAKPTAQTHKFRKSAARLSPFRARPAARRALIAAQLADPAPPAASGEGPVRTAASAARKRPPAPRPPRDTSLPVPAGDLVAIQFDLAWTGDYN